MRLNHKPPKRPQDSQVSLVAPRRLEINKKYV